MAKMSRDDLKSIKNAIDELYTMIIKPSDFEDDCGVGVYTINEFMDCVLEEDFDRVWGKYPDYLRMAWMLADNGQFSEKEVYSWDIEKIQEMYEDEDFCPEYAFYTEL